MIDYIVNLNNGNENIGADNKTISVEETAKTAKQWELVQEINQLNGLLTPRAIEGVLDTLCDAIINTGAFDLEEHVGNCFRADMEGLTKEVITAISVDPSKSVDGNQYILYAQHATDQQKYGLPFATNVKRPFLK